MRLKQQRPVKSSRSLTFVIDGQTSFGSKSESQSAGSIQKTKPIVIPETKTTSNNNYTITSSRTSSRPSKQQQQSEHNRHMSDVMRLAFLENNDISIEDCATIDFNSTSTHSLLQRNIQQQLQHQRRDQLQSNHQFVQQFQQLCREQLQTRRKFVQQFHQQHFQPDDTYDDDDEGDMGVDGGGGVSNHSMHYQQLQRHQRHERRQHLHLHYQQQQQQQQQQPSNHDYMQQDEVEDTALEQDHEQEEEVEAEVEQEEEEDDDEDDQDYEISDDRIFATAKPASSSGQSRSSARRESASVRRVKVESTSDHHHHAEGGGFLCDEPGCGKSFPSLRKLRHHKVVHSDEFPFVCEFQGCNKKFKRKFGIDLHSTTHFDLDPGMYRKTSNNSSLPFFGRRMQYSMCKPCGQKFKTVHEYQFHMLKHGKEPFKCPVKGCGQTFGIWKSFQKHRASHYFNYYCKMDPSCDHQTSNLQLLKLHIYCCHFCRKLPGNEKVPVTDQSYQQNNSHVQGEEEMEEEMVDEEVDEEESEPEPLPPTPRRDARLRSNPPRSSAFGRHDYI